MMCTINDDMFLLFTKNMYIGDSGVSCHITSNNTSMFDIINIDKLIQGSSGIMPARKMASYVSPYGKLMELNVSTFYGS